MDEISLIQRLQAFFENQAFFDVFFGFFTFLGEEIFLMIPLGVLYWAVNKKLGENLAFAGLLSFGLNGILKDIFIRPRPFAVAPEAVRYVQIKNFFVDTLKLTQSFSFPSGHAMVSATLFSTLAMAVKKWWATLGAGLLVVLVGVSRVYLGVHYPSDVLAGAIVGVIIAVLSYVFLKESRQKVKIYFFCALLMTIALAFNPTPDTVKALGSFTGFACGVWAEQNWINFQTKGISRAKKTVRLLLGWALLMGLWVGMKSVSDTLVWDYIRHFIIILWAMAGYPWLFKKMGI